MKKLILAAGLVAATVLQPAMAASTKSNCTSAKDVEAEQAIRFMTDVMVISSTCQDTVYAEFRLRNRDAILGYQKAMIAHLHGSKQFDTWNTSLANQAAMKQAGLPSTQVCQQAAALMATAKSLDSAGFRRYAASQAALVTPAPGGKCGR